MTSCEPVSFSRKTLLHIVKLSQEDEEAIDIDFVNLNENARTGTQAMLANHYVVPPHLSVRDFPTRVQSAVHPVYSLVQPRYRVTSLHTKRNTDKYGNEISSHCDTLQHLQDIQCVTVQ